MLSLLISVVATAIWPFKTLVKIFFIFWFGFEKQIVLVTSVVPYLYCPPESHKKISFLLMFLQLFSLLDNEQ